MASGVRYTSAVFLFITLMRCTSPLRIMSDTVYQSLVTGFESPPAKNEYPMMIITSAAHIHMKLGRMVLMFPFLPLLLVFAMITVRIRIS